MLQCPNCGAQVVEGAAFCAACGTALSAAVPPEAPPSSGKASPPYPGQPSQPVQQPPYYPQQQPPKKKGGCLKWGLIAIGVFIGLGIIGSILGGGDENAASTTTATKTATSDGSATTTEAPTTTTPQQSEAAYKAASNPMNFKVLNKNPEAQIGTSYTGTAEILQIQESGSETFILANVTKGDYDMWDDLVAFTYNSTTELVEDDIFRYWGVCQGRFDYETMIGGSNSVPQLELRYVEKVASGQ